MLRRTLLAALCLLVAACVTPVAHPDEPGPFPADYEAIVKQWAATEIRNVGRTSDFEIAKPEVGAYYQRPVLQQDKVVCWATRASFDARTDFGVARGRMRYEVFIRDGKVVNSRLLP